MASTFDKTSFIPQKSLSPRTVRKRSTGLFFVVAVLLFIISVSGSIGVFAYKKIVKSGIEDKAISLNRAKEAFDPGLIEDLSRLNSRIESAQGVLDSHIVITPFLSLLEGLTLKNVQFENLQLSVGDNGEILLAIDGNATDYATVVLQSDTFGQSRFLREQIFSNINLDNSGNVRFSLKAKVDPNLLSFRNSIEGF